MTRLFRSATIVLARPSGLRASMQLGAHLGDDLVISFGDHAKLGFKSAIARGLPATNPAQRA